MIWGYRLQPSVPSLRSHKRSKRRKGATWPPAQSAEGPRGHCLLPTLSAFPRTSAYGLRASRLRPATPGPERAGGPAEARQPLEQPRGPGGADGEGVTAPPPRRDPDSPNGGAAASSAGSRRALPARPAALATPRALGADPGGPPGAPWAALLRGAPGKGVRPSRGYITGLGPSRDGRGPRGPRRRRRGRRRSPAVDALGDPVPL